MNNDERVLTHAIEKAASLALVMDKDRSELLAGILKEANVDTKYARTATAAFNKRASVLEMGGRSDTDRADDFALADPDKVFELMGGDILDKVASLQNAGEMFHIGEYGAPALEKVASDNEDVPVTPYESYANTERYTGHLLGMMEKLGRAFSKERGDMLLLGGKIEQKAERLAREFSKKAHLFEFECASRFFGEDFREALSEYMPGTTFIEKRASVPLDTELFKEASELVDMHRHYKQMEQDTHKFGEQLAEFAEDINVFGNFLEKTAGMRAAVLLNPSLADAAADVLEGTAGAVANVMGAGANRIDDNLTAYRDLTSGGGSAKGLLDPKLVNFDRNLDRMVAFSDLSADDQFKMYPAEQLFRAVNNAMDLQPALETPASRARLRTVVGQLLAQNNRASLADITAMDAAMKDRKGYTDNVANQLTTIADSAKVEPKGWKELDTGKTKFRTDYRTGISDTTLEKLRKFDDDVTEMLTLEKETPEQLIKGREADARRKEMEDRLQIAVEEQKARDAEREAKNKEKLDTYSANAQMAEQMRRFNEEYGENIVEMVDKPYSELTDEERKGIALEGKRVPKRLALRPGMEERGFVLDSDAEGNVVYLGPAEGRNIPTATERKQMDAQNEAQRKAEEEDAKRVSAEEKRQNIQSRLENLRGLSGTPEERRGVVSRMSAQDIKDQYKGLLDEIKDIEGISDADRQALEQEAMQVISNKMSEEEARVKALSDSDMESRAERLAERLIRNSPRSNRRKS
jgi:hypothetical protein